MAVVYRESGAWVDSRKPLHQVGLFPKDPSEVRELVPVLENEWAQSEPAAVDAFEVKSQKLTDLVGATQTEYTFAAEKAQLEHEAQMEMVNRWLNPPPDKVSVARRLKRWLLLGPMFLRGKYFEKRHSLQLAALKRIPERAENTLQLHLRCRDQFVDAFRSKSRERVEVTQAVLDSKEFAGAVAEVETLTYLKQLPDDFHVVSDARLAYHRHLFYEQEHLKTAQLDFVVVGPPGVFLIEVKHWSREFTESGNYHDPYKQVDRASYLCYKMLKEVGLKTKVRSIIATRSRLPPKPARSYAKVLAPSKLCGFVQYFPPVLKAEQIQTLVKFFNSGS